MPESLLQPPPDLTSPPRKAILFCPACGHESHPRGDWVVNVSDDRYRYGCPDCGEVVIAQPRYRV